MASVGGNEVVIHRRGDVAYPAPRAAYAAVGFTRVNRTRTYGRGWLNAAHARRPRKGPAGATGAAGGTDLLGGPSRRQEVLAPLVDEQLG